VRESFPYAPTDTMTETRVLLRRELYRISARRLMDLQKSWSECERRTDLPFAIFVPGVRRTLPRGGENSGFCDTFYP
jgi:hypothetical protein